MYKATKMLLSLLMLSLPLSSFAVPLRHEAIWHHTGWHPSEHAVHPGWHPHPGYRVKALPGVASKLFIGGLTYYIVNGIYYQRQASHYIVVSAPELHPIDYKGRRYYVENGHYYKRDLSGHYTEVPHPRGL